MPRALGGTTTDLGRRTDAEISTCDPHLTTPHGDLDAQSGEEPLPSKLSKSLKSKSLRVRYR